MNQLLLEYMRTHEISDEMIWKRSATIRMVIEDTIVPNAIDTFGLVIM